MTNYNRPYDGYIYTKRQEHTAIAIRGINYYYKYNTVRINMRHVLRYIQQ